MSQIQLRRSIHVIHNFYEEPFVIILLLMINITFRMSVESLKFSFFYLEKPANCLLCVEIL